MWVSLLGAIVLFIYAVLSFAFLYDRFYHSGNVSLYCDTLLQCFVTVVRFGLLDNLGQVCIGIILVVTMYVAINHTFNWLINCISCCQQINIKAWFTMYEAIYCVEKKADGTEK